MLIHMNAMPYATQLIIVIITAVTAAVVTMPGAADGAMPGVEQQPTCVSELLALRDAKRNDPDAATKVVIYDPGFAFAVKSVRVSSLRTHAVVRLNIAPSPRRAVFVMNTDGVHDTRSTSRAVIVGGTVHYNTVLVHPATPWAALAFCQRLNTCRGAACCLAKSYELLVTTRRAHEPIRTISYLVLFKKYGFEPSSTYLGCSYLSHHHH